MEIRADAELPKAADEWKCGEMAAPGWRWPVPSSCCPVSYCIQEVRTTQAPGVGLAASSLNNGGKNGLRKQPPLRMWG